MIAEGRRSGEGSSKPPKGGSEATSTSGPVKLGESSDSPMRSSMPSTVGTRKWGEWSAEPSAGLGGGLTRKAAGTRARREKHCAGPESRVTKRPREERTSTVVAHAQVERACFALEREDALEHREGHDHLLQAKASVRDTVSRRSTGRTAGVDAVGQAEVELGCGRVIWTRFGAMSAPKNEQKSQGRTL